MGEIETQIEELKSLLDMDLLPDETKEEIRQSLKMIESVRDYDKQSGFKKIQIKYINQSTNKNPVYAKVGDSGFDLRANEGGTLKPLERTLVGTGLYFELPDGYELQIRPRSGLSLKHGITVLNTPGTVDCFSEDMLITTIDGKKRIKDISINDVILSYNIEEDVIEKDVITKIFDTGEQEIIKITTDRGVLEVTENSEVLTNNGWKFAKDLKHGDKILTD